MDAESNENTILAVDDDESNLEIIEQTLIRENYEVECVQNGAQALAMLLSSPDKYDLVLLDRMMPVMDGMEMLERIVESPDLRKIPVVIQTAATNPQQEEEGIKAGAYKYLKKPHSKEQLIEVVQDALAHKDGYEPEVTEEPAIEEAPQQVAIGEDEW